MKLAIIILLLLQPGHSLIGKLFVGNNNNHGVVASPAHLEHQGIKLPPTNLDNKGLEYLFRQNQEWKASKIAEDENFFDNLGTINAPDFMYIGR
jgi:hypothetical protein